MDKVYRNTAIFIVLIIFGVQWGFYKTYLSEFPDFKGNANLDHIHGALMMLWMVLLVVQPLLISSGRANLHRQLGKISYVLGPILIISLFLIGKSRYWNDVARLPIIEPLAVLVLPIRGLVCFTIFWSLAMINRKNSSAHMRYMIGTGILAIGPGAGRVLIHDFGFSFHNAHTVTQFVEFGIAAVFLAYDIYKKREFRPSLTIAIAMLVGAILWQVKYTDGWQAFAAKYAALFY